MAAFVSEVPALVRLTGVAVAMDLVLKMPEGISFTSDINSRKHANHVITQDLAPTQFTRQDGSNETDDRCDHSRSGIA
jgi:hypothetical protein